MFQHLGESMYLVLHGDDCWATAVPRYLEWFEKRSLGTFEGKMKGRFAQAGNEVRILNRVAFSHDPVLRVGNRHTARRALLVRSSGLLVGSNGLKMPGRKQFKEEADREEEPLEGSAASDFRAKAARANSVAMDPPDVA